MNGADHSSAEIKHVKTNGADFPFVEKGHGVPILLVHGSLCDFSMWSAQMDDMACKHRVIALSRRYHWPNLLEEDPKDYTPQLHAADLVSFIRALKIQPVHLVGHSYGAFICALVAKDHPELIRTLTLIEPPMFTLLSAHSERPPFITFASNLFEKGEDHAAVKLFVEGVHGVGSFERLSPAIQKHMLLNAREMRAELRMPPDQHLCAFSCDDAQQIEAPVLLVKGENSPLFFHTILDKLHACVPASSEIEISAASHGVQFENPEAFNEALLKFLVGVENTA